MGKAKYEMKKLIYSINYKFRLGKKRAIPHITLAGPITTNNEGRLLHDFKNICSKYSLMGFRVDGFDIFENSKVVYIDIKPSEKFEEFRTLLHKTIEQYCTLPKNNKLHATLAMKLSHEKFNQIKNHVNQLEKPNYKYYMLRITLLKNAKILSEYDFLQKRALNRWEAKSGREYYKTMELFKNYSSENQGVIAEPIERTTKKQSFWNKIKSFLGLN